VSLRVVHVCAYFAPAYIYGGPPRSLLRLCQAQQASGLSVRVVTTSANGDGELPPDVITRGEYDGVSVRYCPRGWPRRIFAAPALKGVVAEALRHADVMHLHGLWNATVWAAHAAARGAGRPYVLSPRGMLEPAARAHDGWRKRLIYPFFDRRVVRDAALLHATSDVERATLEAAFPRHAVACVPNGVDAIAASDDGDAERLARFGVPASAQVILFLGRLHPIKRLDLLAAGPDEAGLRPAIELRLGASRDRVHWVGAVAGDADKHALLRRCAALVLCSNSESFGLSVAEAMAAGRPVVVTRTCPWPDVAREHAGFWVEQRADAIAGALSTVLDDPNAARDMGRRGRALVEARYSWAHVADALAVQYAQLVAAPLP
jgi:glycosyltransferase involved in cell wall biosynthesis